MPETPTFGRYAEIPYDQMTPEQQEGYRFLVEVRGAAGGPSKIWVHNPKLVKASAPLGAHFHPGGYSLSECEREIAVIIINSKWHSAYPTNAHERRGKEVGLPAEKVEMLFAHLKRILAGKAMPKSEHGQSKPGANQNPGTGAARDRSTGMFWILGSPIGLGSGQARPYD